jgi:hypothetical protein
MLFARFEQTEQTLPWRRWGIDILTTSRQKIPHQHAIATSHHPKPMMLILPCQSRAAELQLFVSKNWSRRGALKAEVEKQVAASELQSKSIGTSMFASEFTSPVENRRIGYLISLYHGIEAAAHRISGTPCKLVPPLPSKLPKQQCSPVIGILQLTFPAPPIEGFPLL